MADKGSIATGLIDRMALRILSKLSLGTTGGLRVEATGGPVTISSGSISINTVALVSNAALTQQSSHQDFQTSYRRNLIQS